MFFLLEVKITVYQLFLLGIAVGVVLGLIPLLLGIFRKKTKLALLGFACSVIGGAVSSFIALVVVVVFVWLILKKSTAGDAGQPPESPPADPENDTV